MFPVDTAGRGWSRHESTDPGNTDLNTHKHLAESECKLFLANKFSLTNLLEQVVQVRLGFIYVSCEKQKMHSLPLRQEPKERLLCHVLSTSSPLFTHCIPWVTNTNWVSLGVCWSLSLFSLSGEMRSGIQPQSDCDNSSGGDQNMVAPSAFTQNWSSPFEFKYIFNI